MRPRGTSLTLFLCAISGLALLLNGAWGVGDQPPTPSPAQKPHGMSQVPDAEPAPPDAQQLLVVYGTNNYGYIDVCGCKHKKIRQGSITRRASFVKQLRSRYPELLLVDGGNTFFGRNEQRLQDHERAQPIERAKVLVEAYNRIGYHAVTIGHFDLMLGLDVLEELVGQAKFPVVCANYIRSESGELVFAPYTEVEINGVQVAILGLTNNTLQPHYLATRAPGTEPTDGLAAAKKYVPELRERNDVVVVLSQNDEAFNRTLASEVSGIDFIVDPFFNLGSNKIWVEEEDLRERHGDTTILRCDAQGARLGTLDLWVKKTRPIVDRAAEKPAPDQSSYAFKRYPIEPHFLEDPEIVKLVEAFRRGSKFVNTEALPPLPNKDQYLTQAMCQACHPQQHEFWQNTKHAHAFASLEETGDQWRQDCIGCHVLGYGQTFLEPKDAEPYKNVQCESCHGLNPQHPMDPVKHKWPRIREDTCLTCHNKDQTLTDFHFHRERPKVACPPMQR